MANEIKFEIDSIVDDKIVDGKTLFRIRWKNFSPDDDTWEFKDKIEDKELLQRYIENKAKEEEKRQQPEKLKKAPALAKLFQKKPVQIIASFKSKNKICYRVLFADQTFDSVSSDLLKEVDPTLICDYLVANFQVALSTKKGKDKPNPTSS
ncbi:Chromobox protein 3 [Tritrichomonas foetus]|uniref:Chromobox protein 3 n=1 Tax=Tritrichomonas foetus TaxID=1144522 RepID=A0A1J4KXK8_9EUKA|nr:Chromobox protein 3 [Tritrichomonas foetus]|eukprot:OHT15914.1 Chromobox protein 3 [Tritrichomonas foetus]